METPVQVTLGESEEMVPSIAELPETGVIDPQSDEPVEVTETVSELGQSEDAEDEDEDKDDADDEEEGYDEEEDGDEDDGKDSE